MRPFGIFLVIEIPICLFEANKLEERASIRFFAVFDKMIGVDAVEHCLDKR